jgi:hypothetical protein
MPKKRTQLIFATCIILVQPIILLMIDPWTIVFLSALLNSNEIAGNRALNYVKFVVTCSQTTLVAAWAALSPIRSYIKFPLAILGIAWFWWVQTEGGHYFTAKQAMQLAVQAIIIVFCISVLQIVDGVLRRRRESSGSSQPFQYSIAFLLIWTTVFALFMGLGKIAIARNHWNIEIIHKHYIGGIIYGAYNAISGLLVLGVVLSRKSWILKTFVFFLFVVLILLTKATVDQWLKAHGFGPSSYEEMICQAVYLFATLIPLRWCGLLGGIQKEIIVPTSIPG